MTKPTKVLIDGKQYVPVSRAHIRVRDLEDVIVSQWAGDNWREEYPNTPNILRVVVGDDFDDGEGETVTEFLARLVKGLGNAGTIQQGEES
jgi:hypothetical protein